jgi:uncharacterized membrane protein YozB (DUF420 family)
MFAVDRLLQSTALVGTAAPLGAKLSLIVMLLAAVLFTSGWRLAVRKSFAAHRWVQTAAVCLNAVPVLAWMIRSFAKYIVPELPARLGQRTYALTTVHALVGALGLVLGVFVALRGNELVPARLRFTNYKRFMRTSYALYMLGTLLGVVVYINAYVSG